MKLYVGITDRDWFQFLRSKKADEMNFWRPRNSRNFSAIRPGKLFLFKTKSPQNRIVGGAFLVRPTSLPLDLAWHTFGEKNGTATFYEFRTKISSLRHDSERNPVIGCTVLTQPFYLDDRDFWPPPSDWPPSALTGKSYDATVGEGLRLYEKAREAVAHVFLDPLRSYMAVEERERYGSDQLIMPRLGQGGFRVVVMDEYERRCAITGERTVPVLEAAHIRPYSEDGPHKVSNGLFLRSDLHTLFDRGYLTITRDYRVEMSRRIREEFSNGREYYALSGRPLSVLPKLQVHCPGKEFLEWHQEHCFLE
jgi:putative restriction endonuclease